MNAERYGIGTQDNLYADGLQALELFPGALYGCAGRFAEDPIYQVDEAAAAEFDRQFEPKELLEGLPSQERFRTLSSARRPRAVK